MTPATPVTSSFLRELLSTAVLADADGDEWDLDDVPEASLALAAMCGPSNVVRMVTELLESREASSTTDPTEVRGRARSVAHKAAKAHAVEHMHLYPDGSRVSWRGLNGTVTSRTRYKLRILFGGHQCPSVLYPCDVEPYLDPEASS